MQTLHSPLRSYTVGVGALALATVGLSLLSTSNSAQAQTNARVAVTPLPLKSPPRVAPLPRAPQLPSANTNRNMGNGNMGNGTPTAPVFNGTGSTPGVITRSTVINGAGVTTPVLVYPNGVIIPDNGVVYNPYGNLPVYGNPYGNPYGGVVGGGGVVGSVDPTGSPASGAVNGNMSMGTMNSRTPTTVIGVVATRPGRHAFTLIVGNQRVRVAATRTVPSTLSRGDTVQVQGVLRGQTFRAGSLSILRQR